MRSITNFIQLCATVALAAYTISCSTNSGNGPYEIASSEYQELTDSYLQHVANFEWEDSYALLADDVQFHLPDGDRGTRTVVDGKAAVMDFWNSYVEKSGNDKLAIEDVVHVPVNVKGNVETIGMKGVFDITWFSAKMGFGDKETRVRMNWTFHFNADKKLDGIYTYYDRTPIIEAANRNILAAEDAEVTTEDMVVQVIRIKSDLSEEELIEIAKDRADSFKELPGLLQKYYIRHDEPGTYGGVYIWNSKASLMEFKESELAKTIGQAYKVTGPPQVDISDVLFQLRD